MLHKLNLPAYRPQMEAILNFQGHVLEFACSAPSLPLTRAALLVEFGEQIGSWLGKRCWRGKEQTALCKEIEALIAYVTLNSKEGPDIVDAFHKDREFYNHLNDPDFEFQYPKLKPKAQNVIKPLMVSFYEKLFRKGFPASIHANGNADFAYKTLLKNFYAANTDLKVCPACDGQRPSVDPKILDLLYDIEDEDAGKSDVQIDHFFPKADYPFFAVHFMNLVPLCRNCNLDKWETNPLGQCSGKGALQYTFLPFLKPAIECIEVKVTRTRHLQPKIVFLDTQQSSSQRAHNLNITFGLSNKWERYLENFIEGKMILLTNSQDAQQRDRKRIRRKIKEWLGEWKGVKRELFGQVANLIVQKSYAEYALSDRLEIEVLIDRVTNKNAPPLRPSQTPGPASIPILPE